MKHLAPLRMVEIHEIKKETGSHTTISFKDKISGAPGQFMMVWMPGVDEIPMGYSRLGDIKEFTVHDVGEATNALSNIEPGHKIGIRGPLGKGFRLPETPGKVLIVGGGCGTSPLVPLAEEAARKGFKVVSVVGATTAALVLKEDQLSKYGEVHIATDDGTRGYHGMGGDLAREKMDGVDAVFTCGPEKMMAAILEECSIKQIPCQASMERYMKCGIGICDSCSIGGMRVCADGPVFSAEVLTGLPEFGKWRRGPTGALEKL